MALKRPTAGGASQETQQETAATSTALAPTQGNAVAPQQTGTRMSTADFHAQSGVVLEGINDFSGNYVNIEGSEFEVKATGELRKELVIIPSYAKKYLFAKVGGEVFESDINNRIHPEQKPRLRLEWMDWVEGEEEPQTFVLTLSTTSMIQFENYARDLARRQIPLNSVWTHVTLEKQEKMVDGEKVKWFRTKFTAGEQVQYDAE